MIEQLSHSWLCWVIILLALFCYQQLWLNFLQRAQNERTDHNLQHEFSTVLISALPLIGLLGTIVGLLECFAGIASSGANSELISSGIGSALLTTQLGLVCAIPGWLLQAWMRLPTQNNALHRYAGAK
jgi:biopolymer transport protein ExbB